MTEPIAWAWIKNDQFYDAVDPEEHSRQVGKYTVPLYLQPPSLVDWSYIQGVQAGTEQLGLAESIIKQQELEIKSLKEKFKIEFEYAENLLKAQE